MKKLIRLFFFLVASLHASENQDNYNYDNRKILLESQLSPLLFWKNESKMLDWIEPYTSIWHKNTPAKSLFEGTWFDGGKLNATFNCVQRWAELYPNQTALIWVGEDSCRENRNEIIYTFKELSQKINQAANSFKDLQVKKGDRVCIWLPQIPEAIIAELACAKLGAIHCLLPAHLPANQVLDIIKDCHPKIVITADEWVWNGTSSPMKETLDPYLEDCPYVKNVIVVQRTQSIISMKESKDYFWNKIVSSHSEKANFEAIDSAHPLFLLYSHKPTSKPLGMVHSTAGYLTYVMSTMKHTWNPEGLWKNSPEIKKADVWFCTEGLWNITGHSYITYAPLALGLVTVLYEGDPTQINRIQDIIKRHHVTLFYSSLPTLTQLISHLGKNIHTMASLSAVKRMGYVVYKKNHTSNEKSYHSLVRCPIIATYLLPETGGYIFTQATNWQEAKASLGTKFTLGETDLCILKPWPGMITTIYGNNGAFHKNYLQEYPRKFTIKR